MKSKCKINSNMNYNNSNNKEQLLYIYLKININHIMKKYLHSNYHGLKLWSSIDHDLWLDPHGPRVDTQE